MRAIDTLRSVDIILAEDTRHTRKLLSRYDVRGRMLSCHRFNEASRIRHVVDKIGEGATVALVTNAGMPGISDPGARLATACRECGIPVSVVPGPSAVTAAIALAGFGGGRFLFEGFLPRGAAARQKRLVELHALPYAVVLFEAPRRFYRLLDELETAMGSRPVFIGRELTKLNEECFSGTASEIRETLARRNPQNDRRAIKGELVVVLAPASRAELKAEAR